MSFFIDLNLFRYPNRIAKVDQLIIKMDKEFNRYYNKPSDKIIDEKFQEKIEFCFDVYEHILNDLSQDLPVYFLPNPSPTTHK